MSENDTTTEATETTEAAPEQTPLQKAERKVGALHRAHAEYIENEYGVQVDPLHIFLTYSTRNRFRATEAYREGVAAQREQERQEAEAEKERLKAERAEAREKAKAEREAEKARKAEEREKARQEREAEKAAKAEKRAAEKAAEGETAEGETSTKQSKRRGKTQAKAEKAAEAAF